MHNRFHLYFFLFSFFQTIKKIIVFLCHRSRWDKRANFSPIKWIWIFGRIYSSVSLVAKSNAIILCDKSESQILKNIIKYWHLMFVHFFFAEMHDNELAFWLNYFFAEFHYLFVNEWIHSSQTLVAKFTSLGDICEINLFQRSA